MTSVNLPSTIANGDVPDWDDVQTYFDAIVNAIETVGLQNENIAADAAIEYSKLDLAGSIDTGDLVDESVTLAKLDPAISAADLATVPMCILAQTSNVGSYNGAAETWASESLDTDGMHSTGSNTSRITVQTDGVYRITASVEFNATLAGAGVGALIYVLLNGVVIGTAAGRAVDATGSSAVYSARAEFDAPLPATAGQYFEVVFAHSDSGSKSATKRFSLIWEGPSS